MTDTNKLKELAERATPGDWSYSPCVADKHFLGQVWNGSGESLCIMVHMTDQANADGAYIAAANPQAILGLIERLEKAEQHWSNENSNNMALIAEVERLRKDAERYRALVDSGKYAPSAWGMLALRTGPTLYSKDQLDAAIDAALEGVGI